ncbi:DNA polymerase subunit beta [Cohnella ginsengisoli]|uniref:DNA polymerase subunit beta n=1 Tax=Cohnella ginsengisoli TaxID=425004 RepID=A0A9X4QQC9_9BACL|nr:DNA polymerase subunit beta [Cohnella ginsengisoli]MDG0794823.1 DNA polymerase subunit beta [Cohnella ginsengisoli]
MQVGTPGSRFPSRRVAALLDDDRREDLVTDTGGWGPWINGGGWLKIGGTPVDFLYRDIGRVSKVIEQCLAGNITIDYQPGHPHGFVNSIYMAEIALCQALWDPGGAIGRLKSKTDPYPPVFQRAVIQKFFWEAGFSLENGYKGIYKADMAYVAGCCFRSSACLHQVLFAINEAFLMNEKEAAAIADTLPDAPSGYAFRINDIFARIGVDPDETKKALELLRELLDETEQLIKAKAFLK